MGRKVDVEHLVGAQEIAEKLDLKRVQVVYNWRRRHADFPAPLLTLSSTAIWDLRDVQRWVEKHHRSRA